ncbi:DUF2852 domain-containing protein [Jannaschia aquimarina]|uniref:DUF2852 domain-containing protein n=1 Tax=Jannaschia aquimarina TaxID=935700 RepID=A0A0D1CQB3_9RHOB|nr:DUF2852 domain-containing protein [Jannaschia aquimarina]KIT16967.1 hypothetical protein jaqu_12800 [Jannaschia aquimarina]SNT33288.1 Protein of unknown function [Jannaschia aquimarina]
MQTAPAFAAPRGNPLRRAEAWLDARGKGAWIAAMIAGFILFWPIGLALVLYMTFANKWSLGRSHKSRSMSRMTGGTGNTAFDAYKADMLRRLEDEQRAFEEFLERLREAKDKAEFDQFMDERERKSERKEDDGTAAA